METNGSEKKPGTSKNYDLIIITPDELLKLGLTQEIIDTRLEKQKLRNESIGSGVRETHDGKSTTHDDKTTAKNIQTISDNKMEDKTSATFFKLAKSKIVRSCKNHSSKDALHINQDKRKPIVLPNKKLNKKADQFSAPLNSTKEHPALLESNLQICKKNTNSSTSSLTLTADIKCSKYLSHTKINTDDNLSRKITPDESKNISQSSREKVENINPKIKLDPKDSPNVYVPSMGSTFNTRNNQFGENREDAGNSTTISPNESYRVKENETVLNISEDVDSLNFSDANKRIKITSNTLVHLSNKELQHLIVERDLNMKPSEEFENEGYDEVDCASTNIFHKEKCIIKNILHIEPNITEKNIKQKDYDRELDETLKEHSEVVLTEENNVSVRIEKCASEKNLANQLILDRIKSPENIVAELDIEKINVTHLNTPDTFVSSHKTDINKDNDQSKADVCKTVDIVVQSNMKSVVVVPRSPYLEICEQSMRSENENQEKNNFIYSKRDEVKAINNEEKMKTVPDKNTLVDNVKGNIDLQLPMASQEQQINMQLQKEERKTMNEVLQCSTRTSVIIPKKRKCHMKQGFFEETLMEDMCENKKSDLIPDISTKNVEKMSTNKPLTIPKKRLRRCKMITYDLYNRNDIEKNKDTVKSDIDTIMNKETVSSNITVLNKSVLNTKHKKEKIIQNQPCDTERENLHDIDILPTSFIDNVEEYQKYSEKSIDSKSVTETEIYNDRGNKNVPVDAQTKVLPRQYSKDPKLSGKKGTPKKISSIVRNNYDLSEMDRDILPSPIADTVGAKKVTKNSHSSQVDSNETETEILNIEENKKPLLNNIQSIAAISEHSKIDTKLSRESGRTKKIANIENNEVNIENNEVDINVLSLTIVDNVEKYKDNSQSSTTDSNVSETCNNEKNRNILIDEDNVAMSNLSVVLPRKRGRPKKISSVEINKDSITVNSHISETKIYNIKDDEKDDIPNEVVINELSDIDKKLSRKGGRTKKIACIEDGTHLSKADCDISETELNNIEENKHSDIQKNVTNGLSNEDIKLPRKRGRPKKISSIKDNNDLSKATCTYELNQDEVVSELSVVDMKVLGNSMVNIGSNAKEDLSVTSTSVDSNPEQVATSIPLPKKRGRKRKSEQPPQPPVEQVEEHVELDESRSGRKRRKVNYLEFANELDNLDDGEYKKRHKFSAQAIEKVMFAKKQNVDNQTQETPMSDKHSLVDHGENSTSNHSELNKPESTINEENLNDYSDNENENPPKYRKTGETVMMMNSVFAAALKNKSLTEAEDTSTISSDTSSLSIIPMNINKGRGRRRKSQEFASIIIDEANMVICVSCNKKVNNDDWEIHNRQEHNNLTWREGEQELMLDDGRVVVKILKPILKEDKAINCKKCNNSFKKIGAFTSHLEKCNGIVSCNGLITCAVCNIQMEKTRWSNHKQRHHNNLAWRIGDRPLNLNDQNLVVNILTALYKAKKPLYCEKCGASKKSVIGFLSHQSQCGIKIEEAKVQCQFCDKKVLPVSMQCHVKMVHETPKEKTGLKNSDYFDIEINTSLTKREAAKMAMAVINKFSSEKMVQEHSKHYMRRLNFIEENFVILYFKKELSNNGTVKCKFHNCSYESDSAKNLVEHMSSCEVKPEEYYTCRKCLSITDTEEDMKKHLKDDHNIEVVVDEYQANENNEDAEDEMWEQYDIDIKKRAQYERMKLEKDPNYKVKPSCILGLLRKQYQLFSESYNYTISFCENHFSTDLLFNDLRYVKFNWLLLHDDLVGDYLPQCGSSCDVAVRKVNDYENVLRDEYTFKKFEIFETESNEGAATIFCGGPIQAMAWLPTPYTLEKCKQVLAVASLTDFDKKYLVNQHYNDKSVIQFWDFGVLKNKCSTLVPKLMFSLAIDCGPVWHMEWCPSGCFDVGGEERVEMLRLGLLAVAGSDSVVYIYSIPHLKEEDIGLIYKVKPLMKLQVTLKKECNLSNQKFYATKISWSKASGHRYIAVGYTDGVVGLFDVGTASNLLKCKDKNDCEVLLPYKLFQPHSHIITVLDLIHLDDGKRWLLTGSFDRNIIIWDLNNNLKMISKKNIISDGLWLTNWMSFLFTTDESSTTNVHIPTFLKSYRDYMYEHVILTALTSSSTIKAVSASSWLNAIIYCNALGETTAMFPSQLLCGLDNDKQFKNSIYMFGYTKLINKHLTPEERVAEDQMIKSSQPDLKKHREMNFGDYVSATENLSYKYQPNTYQEASEKYGLLFCDAKMDNFKDFFTRHKKKSDRTLDLSKADLYSMQAINKVAYNPNLQSSLYYAAGYQAGFVRIIYMNFLENDPQVI